MEWYSDGVDPTAEHRLALVKGAINEHVPGEFVIEDLTRVKNGKVRNSFHLYMPDKRFVDNSLIKDLITMKVWPALAHLPEISVDGKPVIDLSVYTKNRQYRLPGCSKFQDNQTLPLPSLDFFSQCIVSRPLPATVDYTATPYQKASRKRKAGVHSQPVHASTASTEEHKAVVAVLRSKGDVHTEVVWDGIRYVGKTHPEHGRGCLVGGEHCDTNDCVLFVAQNGDVWYHCFAESEHKYFKGKPIGNIFKDRIKWDEMDDGRLQFTGSAPSRSVWDPGVKIRTRDDDWIQPIEPEPTTKTYCRRGGMGMGKSRQSAALVRKYVSEQKRILIVSSRIAFCSAQKGMYERPERDVDDTDIFEQLGIDVDPSVAFSHYSEKNWKADRLIIQYESLHHLHEAGAPRFDLIILDEIRSIANNMTSLTTNGDNLRLNSSVLTEMIKASELSLAMDANLEFDGSPRIPAELCLRPSSD